MPRTVVIHYGEIGLKGKNRWFFERKLLEAVDRAAARIAPRRAGWEHGRLVLDLGDEDPAPYLDALQRVPGIAWLAPAEVTPLDADAMVATVVDQARRGPPDASFRVEARRANKKFPLTSVELNRQAGAAVVAATRRPVDLEEPAVTYSVEIGEKRAYVYSERRRGLGGLPTGTAGRLLALLSGGIDSPVAAFRMMRRGCLVAGLHFFNETATSHGVRDKLDRLCRVLARYQGRMRLHVVPFEPLQREIVMTVPAPCRMIVYRRMMFRIAERMLPRERALGFVTGDSIGQVASQTLRNLRVIYAAAEHPVYTPLAGMDKTEIVDEARRIGTFEVSILPYGDCCSFLVPAHPETAARLAAVEAMERFDVEGFVAAAAAGTVTKVFTEDGEVTPSAGRAAVAGEAPE
jgi:thiamine biosynthesis protein ThiI